MTSRSHAEKSEHRHDVTGGDCDAAGECDAADDRDHDADKMSHPDGQAQDANARSHGHGHGHGRAGDGRDWPEKARRRKHSLLFLLGGLCGIIMAGFLAQHNDLIDFASGDLNLSVNMDSILDFLPAGVVQDMRNMVQGERNQVDSSEAFAVGLQARAEGMEAYHPFIMIPGVISTGLESWGTSNVSRPYFRKRLWGSWGMIRALVLDKELWKRHIMLDKYTGLDPPEIKLRAAQGFDATDFFITGYWIWNKILENLASIGYDPTNSFTAAYDWRLSYANLEVRDRYFSRLQWYVETAVATSGRKVVLTSHSMGSQVMFFFFHWVGSDKGGGGGADWVERHVDSWINISGCMLGAVKALTALLSGEMRDTAQLNAFAMYGLERFLSKEERREIFRAMPGMSSMLPIGGDAVWGTLDGAPDEGVDQPISLGSFLNFRSSVGADAAATTMASTEAAQSDMSKSGGQANLTMDEAVKLLLSTSEDWYQDQVRGSYSRGVAHTAAEVEANEGDPRKWVNPLETRLPLAPSLRIFCFYGVGKPTERAYYYRDGRDSRDGDSAGSDGSASLGQLAMDTGLVVEGEVNRGVVMGDGDGTVNLLSIGYMCNSGWGLRRYNPAGVRVTVVEMAHEPERFNPRGGPRTADHVDILGRPDLHELILRIAAGRGSDIEDHVVSRIREYGKKVAIFEEE